MPRVHLFQDHSSEPPSAKGLAVFRDPQYKPLLQRTATSINWHPEGAYKIAVSYSVLTFQVPPIYLPGHGHVLYALHACHAAITCSAVPASQVPPTTRASLLLWGLVGVHQPPSHVTTACWLTRLLAGGACVCRTLAS